MKSFIILQSIAFTCYVNFGLAQSNADSGAPTRTYPLDFRDGHTEGSWAFILDNRRWYEIEFSIDSNPNALAALSALNPEIIRLNTASERNIYLIGVLINEGVSKDKVREKSKFRLDGWYIKVPFYVPGENVEADPIEISLELLPLHFLPAGERPDSDKTKTFRSTLKIQKDKRLNHFWIGAESPMKKFLAKTNLND